MIKQIILFPLQVILYIGFYWGIAIADDKSAKVKVFYIPFQAQTLMAVTTDLIEQKAYCKFKFDRNSGKAKRLIRIINEVTDGLFEYPMVRLKITGLFPHNVFVDNTGGILRGNEDDFRLKPNMLGELETLLNEWAEAKGCY